jgi:hypothetical protein
MTLKCATCDAELMPGTSFCRQCGVAVSNNLPGTDGSSEEPTAHFNQSDSLQTRLLEPRSTSDHSGDPRPQHIVTQPAARMNQTRRWIILAGAVSVLLICIVGVVWFIGIRGRNSTNAALLYPGAKTILDMKYDDGSRAVHLETNDSLGDVENWYQASLKPAKTMRLTPGSVVLKSDNKTVTLVTENNKTSVLIKMTP